MAVTDEFRSSHFKLRRQEHLVMPNALTWLHSKNPWFAAYKNSVNAVKETWEELTTHLDNIGQISQMLANICPIYWPILAYLAIPDIK